MNNLKFVITCQDDGSWTIQVFDGRNNKLGKTTLVKTPSEAWKLWMLLNGYGWDESQNFEIIENTEALEVA